MDKTIKQVYETKEYRRFKFFPENRDINAGHLKKLINSMKQQFLVSPLIVNKDYYIIDGQHRYTACKALDLPIYYLIIDKYGLNETKIYNMSNKNWDMNDFLNFHIELGNKNYIKYADFKAKFPLRNTILLSIIADASNVSHKLTYEFKEGNLKFSLTEEMKTLKVIHKILDFKDFFSEYNKYTFVNALLKIFRLPDYDHQRMIEKTEFQAGKIRQSTRTRDYLKQLEDIYNYKIHNEKDKIRFFGG